MPQAPPEPIDRPLMVGTAIVVVAAAVIRWHNIGDHSLWLDEIGEAVVAQSNGIDFLGGVRSHAGAAPLDYLGVKAVMGVLGSSTIAVRMWSFAAGVLAVLATLFAARELTGSNRVALVAALLLAGSPFHVFYSQEARFYSLATLMAALILWSFARADRLGGRRDWALYGGIVVAGLYTHYFLGLIVAIQGAWLLWRSIAEGGWRRKGRAGVAVLVRRMAPFVVSAAVAGIVFLPWFLYAVGHQVGADYGYEPNPPLSPDQIAIVVTNLIAPHAASETAAGTTATRAGAVATAGVLVLAILGLLLTRRATLLVPAAVALLAVPFAYLANAISSYTFAERQVIMILPALALLAGSGIVRLAAAVSSAVARRRRLEPRRVEPVLIAFLVAILAIAAVPSMRAVYAGTWRIKEDWRAASAAVAARPCAGLVYGNINPMYRFGFAWYQPQLLERAIQITPGEPVLTVLARTDLRPDDQIVILRDTANVFVRGIGGLTEITSHLKRRGFVGRDYTPRLRVFWNPAGCGPS
jgi:uncharacterized membrane protein